MIVLPKQELVILTPPKTGSSSAHAKLCSPEFGGIHVEGPLPGNPIDIECHTFVIPRRYCQYKLAVLIRNPYARAKSLHAHQCRYENERCDLISFVRDKLIERSNVWWYWPVSIFARMAKRFSGQSAVEVVHLESVRDDLDRLGIVIDEFPRQHVLEDSTPDVTPEIAGSVNLWAGDDFQLGGYPTVGPMPKCALPPDPPQPNWCLHL